jgi:LmbE family N-acetylglucosaminyl deacetylase
MKLHLQIFLLFALSPLFFFGQTTRVFVAAHQDDWQLFMGTKVFESAQNPTDRTVLLHLTAGDAGHKMGNDSYFRAREASALAAARFAVNANKTGAFYGDEMKREWLQIKGHIVLKYSYKQLSVYFLRLPDGNGDGSGFEANENKSLEKLFNRQIIDFSTIDGQSTYSNKEDLVGTLKALLTEVKQNQALELHLTDTDSERNPGDHSDHRVASLFAQEASKGFESTSLHFYTGYHMKSLEPNLTPDEIKVKSALWGVSTAKLADHRHYSSWDSLHNAYLDREYVRVKGSSSSSSQR